MMHDVPTARLLAPQINTRFFCTSTSCRTISTSVNVFPVYQANQRFLLLPLDRRGDSPPAAHEYTRPHSHEAYTRQPAFDYHSTFDQTT